MYPAATEGLGLFPVTLIINLGALLYAKTLGKFKFFLRVLFTLTQSMARNYDFIFFLIWALIATH